MRLKKKQKEAVLAWISEGLQTDEINQRAAQFKPPFDVSRQQVDWYRDTRRVDLEAIRAADEDTALTTGYADKKVRVHRLQQLATLMERDLLGGFLWTEQVKAVGSGPTQQIVDYEEFNAAEVAAYRGVLDDIAKEVGDRRTINENFNVDWSSLTDEQVDRLIAGEDPRKVLGGGKQ